MTYMKFVVLIWAVFQMFLFAASDTNSTTESHTLVKSKKLAKPGCNSTCGDLVVPYPFGVGDNSECYIEERFRIYCDTSLNPPKATIEKGGYNSIKNISDSTIRLYNQLASRCRPTDGSTIYNRVEAYINTPYTFSKVNKFTVIGCNYFALLDANITYTGCMVNCFFPQLVVHDECTGNGCCQSPTSVLHGITNYRILILSVQSDDMNSTNSFFPCTYAFVGEENVFKFKGLSDLNDTNFIKRIEDTVPLVLEWAIGNRSCSEASATDGFACQSNSICVDSTRKSGGYRCECKEGYEGNPYLSPGCLSNIICVRSTRYLGGYRCECKEGYEGNPYLLSPGCQDINECERKEDFPCYGTCINTPGNYTCKCKEGYYGDGKIPNGCRSSTAGDSKFTTIIFILGVVLGTGILVMSIGAYKLIQKRKDKRRKEKFFKRNGGLLL